MPLLLKKFKEIGLAVLPILALMLVFYFTGLTKSMGGKVFTAFIIGAVLVVVGEVLFLVGVDNSILMMGSTVGAAVPKFKKLFIVLGFGFLFGFLCTMAEPDLRVLGSNAFDYAGINIWLLMCVVSLGVGVFVMLSMVRTFTHMKLKYILLVSYALAFALAIAVSIRNPEFFAMGFDSGGVTTGPVTVPFVLALGIGVAASKSGSKTEDSFGMIALASVGPIIAMFVLGLFFKVSAPQASGGNPYGSPTIWQSLFGHDGDLGTAADVALGLGPITIIFLLFNFFKIKLPRKKLYKILAGVLISYIGLTLFLGGVGYGFSAAAYDAGQAIASNAEWWWVLIPAGLGIGAVTVYTEPGILILGAQVEEVTGGGVTKKTLVNTLALAVGVAAMLGVLRALFEINLWWIIGAGYAAALILIFLAPDIFVALAFDAGGVASGPMTATFTLPLVMGICAGTRWSGEDALKYAFGLVSLVAMMPLIAVQGVGVMFKYKSIAVNRKLAAAQAAAVAEERAMFTRLRVQNDADFSRI